jgi:hypothetical protein
MNAVLESGGGNPGEERKTFFFEKKNQKTFDFVAHRWRTARQHNIIFFASFSDREALALSE